MFDMGIGMGEMIFLAVIALVVLGPEKFPQYAKMFLRAFKDVRGYMDEVKTDVAREINPLRRELDKLNRTDPEKLIDTLMGGDEKKPEVTAEGAAAADTAADSTSDADPYARPPDSAETDGDAPEAEATPSEFDVTPPERMD
ncbi:MAG: twin-arginine translocase subunit TatB [Candidatus Hydrogenedentes bacterium]|nr:twin-arginine translocase subunit TatB [Candidatus Hydrogenedentota bacterium]